MVLTERKFRIFRVQLFDHQSPGLVQVGTEDDPDLSELKIESTVIKNFSLKKYIFRSNSRKELFTLLVLHEVPVSADLLMGDTHLVPAKSNGVRGGKG